MADLPLGLEPEISPEVHAATATALRRFATMFGGAKAQKVDALVYEYARALTRAGIEDAAAVRAGADACVDACTYFPKPAELRQHTAAAQARLRAGRAVARDDRPWWSGQVDEPCPTCGAWPVIREVPCVDCPARRAERTAAGEAAARAAEQRGLEAGMTVLQAREAGVQAGRHAALTAPAAHVHYAYDAPPCPCNGPTEAARAVGGMRATPDDVRRAWRAREDAPPSRRTPPRDFRAVAAEPDAARERPALGLVR